MRANPLPEFPPLPPPRRRAGFTLVEIMAVMMVIAILLSVAAVGIQSIDRVRPQLPRFPSLRLSLMKLAALRQAGEHAHGFSFTRS